METAMQTNPFDEQPVPEGARQLAQRLGITESRIHELRAACKVIDEICADYGECVCRLEQLEQTAGADSPQARDYRELKEQLEGELEGHVGRISRAAGNARGSAGERKPNSEAT